MLFLTGGVTLALEVMSSRIMTPYFGVSLYIWAAILSSTLSFMALGYWLGGRISSGISDAQLEERFVWAPLLSSGALVVAVLVYPRLFPALTSVDLATGSFLGAVVLLALPLASLSAMNPMLIALRIRSRSGPEASSGARRDGDAGAGRIFFLSTVGSVAGVLVTAFLIIPNLSNFRGVLLMAIVLAGGIGALAFVSQTLETRARTRILVSAALILLGSALLSAAKAPYLESLSPHSAQFSIEREYTSIFGNLKVVDFRKAGAERANQRFLYQDGLVQNRVALPSMRSGSEYTYMLDALSQVFAPDAERALVLGLGAGIVPRFLTQRGVAVTAVEINPDVVDAAREYFGFDDPSVEVVVSDARTYVRSCQQPWDLVVVDLFLGDSVPDYLLSREFFASLGRCIAPGGGVVMNSPADRDGEGLDVHLAATLAASFPSLFYTQTETGNGFIAGLVVGQEPPAIGSEAFAARVDRVRANLGSAGAPIADLLGRGRYVRAEQLGGAAPVSDDHNIFSVRFAASDIERRRLMRNLMPPKVMTN